MANTISPNMSLIIPGVGTEAGPTYATDVNNSLTIVDAHNHTAGSGVLITPAAISINTSLPMNNNALTSIGSLTLTPQTVTPGNNNIYESGVDLFFKDGNGNSVQITSGGAVNATSSGISSGTATASFVGGVLVVNAAPLTPANVQGGSFLFGNNVANSKFLTLQPPNAMAANYSVTLPSLPAQTNIMTLDTSGNMGSIQYITNTFLQDHTISEAKLPVNPNFSGTALFASSIPAIMNDTSAGSPQHIVRGKIASNGTTISGSGFTTNHFATGSYQISYTTAFSDFPAVLLTSDTPGAVLTLNASQAPGNFVALATTLGGAPADVQFNFIAMGTTV